MRPVVPACDRKARPGTDRPMLMSWRSDPRPAWLVHLEYRPDVRLTGPGGTEARSRLETGVAATGMAGGAAVAAVDGWLRVNVVVKEDDQQRAIGAAQLVTAAVDRKTGRLLGNLVSWQADPLVRPCSGAATTTDGQADLRDGDQR